MKCEGSCEEHAGEVRQVIVSGHGWNPTPFTYCDNAIIEDRRRGFTVDVPNEPEPSAPSNDYWKRRCEAAEAVIEKFVVLPIHKSATDEGKETINNWQQLKSNPPKEGEK
jgi:hypothetical protein